MRISIELVPRSLEELKEEVGAVKRFLPQVNTINIPDLLRFKLRSWQGCAVASATYPAAIPHIRAIDIDPRRPLAMADSLREHRLDEVLVVAGDAPADLSRMVYNTSSLDAIRKFREELPHVTVYAALDPYRQSLVEEREYALRKLEAGAAGLFTQPFFDLRLMEVFADFLPAGRVFWGATPVMSARTLNYWQTRNKAVFPAAFQPTLEWNRAFARDALNFARQRGDHIYFMPIATSVQAYLEGIV